MELPVATPNVNATGPTANDFLNMSDEAVAKAIDLDGQVPVPAPAAPETPAPAADEAKPAEAKADEKPQQDTTGYYQDDAGKWHRPDGKFADGSEVEAIKAALQPAVPGTSPAGTETAAAKDAPPPAQLTPEEVAEQAKARGFMVESSDGTPFEEFPDVKFKFNADGKEREADIPSLVRLAKMGYYNERREQEVAQTKQLSGQTYQQLTQLQQALQERDLLIERYMADPQYREAAVHEYQRLNSPEVRLQRLQQQREQEMMQTQEAQRLAAAQGYISNSITPRVEAIHQQFPAVTEEELLGRMTLLTSDLTMGGKVPLEMLPEVERRIEYDLRPWAEQRAHDREGPIKQVQAKARAYVDAAKVQTAMAKRQVARAATGLNNGQVAPNTPPIPSKPKSADEWMEQMFGKEDR